MDNWLKIIKDKFGVIIQLSVWIFSILSPFVIAPQIDNYPGESKMWFGFAQFLIPAFIGLAYFPFSSYTEKKYVKMWFKISLSALFIGIISFVYYISILQNKRVIYPTAPNSAMVFVIGNDAFLTTAALDVIKDQENRTHEKITNEVLLKLFAIGSSEELENIWKKSSITFNTYLIVSMYISTLVLFTFFILTLIQALNCKSKK